MHVKINGIATAVPPFSIDQAEVRDAMNIAMDHAMPPRIARIYDNTGVDTRHLVQPAEAYLRGQDWPTRNRLYLDAGQKLLERVAQTALREAGLVAGDIDMILCVSSTGIATPSIPTQMLEPMGFRPGTPILPLFGYGCAGGVIGLQVARDMVLADPARKVLLLTMELCSLAFRFGDISKKAIIASTLFGDGSSAIVLSAEGDGAALGAFAQHSWPGTRAMMGWDIDEMGLGLVLSRDIPSFVSREFGPVLDRFLADQGMAKAQLAEPACHPGGRKVVEALEHWLGTGARLEHTRKVLASHGNMSAPTVHFVLQSLLTTNDDRPILMTALGPGFTGAMGLVAR